MSELSPFARIVATALIETNKAGYALPAAAARAAEVSATDPTVIAGKKALARVFNSDNGGKIASFAKDAGRAMSNLPGIKVVVKSATEVIEDVKDTYEKTGEPIEQVVKGAVPLMEEIDPNALTRCPACDSLVKVFGPHFCDKQGVLAYADGSVVESD
jgi:hypothetical protein